ncbi:hypothetical protein JL721_508 [Aureococcus anophagefferens]|nr:hypothetical protein JL721_508 [Aureococcus anophagefferens]
MLDTAAASKVRYNTLLPSPAGAKYSLAVVQFKVPGHPNGGSDKGPDGNRIDSIPIANGVIKAGGACDMLLYDYTDHAGFEATIEKYDALIVRINPGQLSQIRAPTAQAKFDATMNACVVKQNRGSAGEGIWLCWIANETKDGIIPDIDYPSKTFGAESLGDDVMLKLMEMNDNHVEYHTVKEFLLVDQRLLPRISEGEVRVLMAGDTCQMIIHKKPEGGLSAVGGNSAYHYEPPDPPTRIS